MLELIVLGQIPGTHLQITFAWCAVAVLGLFIWADIKIHRFLRTPTKRGKTVEVVRPGQV